MTRILHGERIGKTARLRVASCATIFDPAREKIFLTRRSDNGQWCLPGGGLEPGESLPEGCVREIWEETGLHIRVLRLLGVYSSPDWLLEYNPDDRFQVVAANFEAEILGGELAVSSETTEFGYFTPAEIEALDLMEHHRQRIADALTHRAEAFFR